MSDTRPVMTDAEFEHAAQHLPGRWWLTGETLIHVPSVMTVTGWNRYGHPGNRSLTPAQRTLMMWSDIVGQISNGGFIQFCDNLAGELTFGVTAVNALAWPELSERFARAMVEQAGDAVAPCRLLPVPLTDDPEKWAVSRKRLIRHLARRGRPWWRPLTSRTLAIVEARYEEWQLELQYQTAVMSGKLANGGERLFDFVAPPSEAADAFDDWFFTDDTKAASRRHVHDFIMSHREELYRSA